MRRQGPLPALALVSLLALGAGAAHAAPFSFGGPGIEPGRLSSPLAIASHAGRLYVADFDNDRVQVFRRSGELVTVWGTTGTEIGRFRGPAGIAVDREGAVYVTDHFNHRVQKFDAEGKWLAAWDAGASAPIGIAIDPEGRVLTTDLGGEVRVWTADGARVATWGGRAHGLEEPWGIAVEEDGSVLVADHGSDRIRRFTSEGEPAGSWGTTGSAAGRLMGPMGIALAPGGAVLVTDLVGDRVQRFGPGGEPMSGWSGSRSAAGLTSPGIASAGREVFVTDVASHRILAISLDAFEPAARVPATFEMAPIAPTPSRGPVVLRLAIPRAGSVAADIYALDGRRVFSSPPTACEPGEHSIRWSGRVEGGRRAAAGVYFVHVRYDGGDRSFARRGRIVVVP